MTQPMDDLMLPLPEPECLGETDWDEILGFTADQMREYAKKAVEAERAKWNEPVPAFFITELSRNTLRFHNAVSGRLEFNKQKNAECVIPVWFTPLD